MTALGRPIALAVTDHVATMLLDNPPLNLLGLRFLKDLDAVCEELASRDDVRAVVITGSGERAFSAGANTGELDEPLTSVDDRGLRLELECRAFERLAALPQPTIAAIRGCALGSGLELALSCDFRIAGRSAELGFPGMRRGAFPASSGLTRLPQIVGGSAAKRLAMLGELIGAEEARAMGLVDEVVADESVVQHAMGLAARLAERAPAAVRAVKRVLDAQRELSREEALRLTLETALSRSVVQPTATRRKEGRPETNASLRS